jgi:beta-glucosidase
LFWEYYSYPFRVGIQEANAQGFMASYNSYNGIPMTVHPVLQDIVRKQWGFDGIICSDGSAVQLMFNPQPRGHGYFYTLEEAAAASVRASVGQFLDAQAQQTLVSAVQHNILTERDLDEALRPVFRVMIRLGLLDPPDNNPYAKIGDGPEPWTLDSSKALAKKVTEESVVLLKNANNTLPLDKSKIKSVAMIGTRANVVRFDWYSSQPGYTITPVEGIQAKLGSNVKVSFASSDDVDAAVNLAKSSDVAICVVGNDPICDAPWAKTESPNEGKESVDRKGIDLDEEPLVKKVFAANPHTIVVLISSFPYAINWTQENIPAIVHMTHCSQEEGSALADVLFGDYNPAGRLVETWPKSLSQIPDLMDYDIRHGRTYMYFKGEPLYAFGYGLSYTNFEYSNLKSADTLAPDGTLDVSVDVKNTGSRDGDEVVQLYVKHIGSGVLRPNKELKGFARVPLKAGETKTVKLQLPAAKLAYWNTTANQWVVERDQVQLMVGTSSADLKLNKTIQITP